MSGAPSGQGVHSGSGGVPSRRSYEDRTAAKEEMMQNLRSSSQQERRVYVGNLSYDVKWHHLKDFMRQGMDSSPWSVVDAASRQKSSPDRKKEGHP